MSENIKTSFTPKEIQQMDRKMRQEDLDRQKALIDQPHKLSDKKIIVIGRKRPGETEYRTRTPLSNTKDQTA